MRRIQIVIGAHQVDTGSLVTDGPGLPTDPWTWIAIASAVEDFCVDQAEACGAEPDTAREAIRNM